MGFLDYFRPKQPEKQPVVARRAHRSYDAAKHRPDWNGWTTASPGPNGLMGDLSPLRARSRDRVRNDSVGSAAISKLTAGIVGENGLTPRWSTVPEAIRERAKTLWDKWSGGVDTTGKVSFQAAQHLAIRGMLESGDALFRKIPLSVKEMREFGGSVPLALQILESDYLASDLAQESGRRNVGGVILNARGRCVGYRLYREHPAEIGSFGGFSVATDDISANEIAHLFIPQRPGQLRGVPHLHAVLARIFGMHDFVEADLVRRRAQATLAGVVRNSVIPSNLSEVGDDDGELDQGALGPVARDANGIVMESIAPGTFAYLDGSEDITFTTPTGQSDLPETIQLFLRMVAAGSGLTYESLSGDMSQTNYSSYRAGRIDSELILSGIRKMRVMPVIQRIWEWWRDAAMVVDPAMAALPEIIKWSQPVIPSTEPQKDVEAARMRVEAGFSSVSEEIEAMGKDPVEVAARRAEEKALREPQDDIDIPRIFGKGKT